MANAPTGSKAELISMIEKLTANDQGGLIATYVKAAKTIAASRRFTVDVVKALTLDSFFDKVPAGVSSGTMRSVSIKIGAEMDGPSFGNWLAENIVAGRSPAQMIDNPGKYGSFGMWRDAKEYCEKLGIVFEEIE